MLMNALDLLRDTDDLQVSSWCQYFGPPELNAIFPESVFPAGCARKASGFLRLTLNSVRHLGIAPPVDFDLELIGTIESADTPSTSAVVRFDVNAPIDKTFDTADGLRVRVLN